MAVKPTHGGKRKDPRGGPGRGQGRKKGVTFKEPTVVMRIPVSKVDAVKKLIGKK